MADAALSPDMPVEFANLPAGKSNIDIEFAKLPLTLDHSGAIYISEHETLVVSDLHLEKGSAYARRGRLIPSYDSCDTLQRLKRAIEAYAPRRVICLGDSFHDPYAGERIAKEDKDELSALCASAGTWSWVSGNHDPEMPGFCGGETFQDIELGGVVLTHEPKRNGAKPQIAGHFHPKIGISSRGYRFSGRCFCVSRALLIMPAFGAFTGGLSCFDPALDGLLKPGPRVFMLHAQKLWRVA